MRQIYDRDWREWPSAKGAPFYDRNGNGLRDPGEDPGLLEADIVAWYAANDLDSLMTNTFYGTRPFGLELQCTWWAYKGTSRQRPLANALFVKYRLINRGRGSVAPTSPITEMYVGKYVDTDLWDFGDDLLGCDSSLAFGYTYNQNFPERRDLPRGYTYQTIWPRLDPSVGCVLLEGPLLPASPTDVGFRDFLPRNGFRNLSMTSFIQKSTGTSIGDPIPGGIQQEAIRMYNWLRGYVADRSLTNPEMYQDGLGNKTRFPLDRKSVV
jgi:hypothetical protein